MAGSRPSTYKRGGGFLDGVDVTIQDYQFTDEFAGTPWKAGKINSFDGKGKIDKPHSLNVFLSVRVDGAEADTTVTLKAAKEYDDWTVSEDGYTVTPTDDSQGFSGSTAWGKLISSLVQPTEGGDGFPEDRLPEDTFNYQPIIGTRLRLVQLTDAERTLKFGRKKNKAGVASWDRKDLLVSVVYDLPTVAGKSNGKAAKPTAKAAKGGVDVKALADETIVKLVTKAGGSLLLSKVSMAVLKGLTGNASMEAVRTILTNEDYYATAAGVDFDENSNTISLSE